MSDSGPSLDAPSNPPQVPQEPLYHPGTDLAHAYEFLLNIGAPGDEVSIWRGIGNVRAFRVYGANSAGITVRGERVDKPEDVPERVARMLAEFADYGPNDAINSNIYVSYTRIQRNMDIVILYLAMLLGGNYGT